MAEEVKATLTITLTQGAEALVYVGATCNDGDDLPLVEALGMIELAKSILLDGAVG